MTENTSVFFYCRWWEGRDRREGNLQEAGAVGNLWAGAHLSLSRDEVIQVTNVAELIQFFTLKICGLLDVVDTSTKPLKIKTTESHLVQSSFIHTQLQKRFLPPPSPPSSAPAPFSPFSALQPQSLALFEIHQAMWCPPQGSLWLTRPLRAAPADLQPHPLWLPMFQPNESFSTSFQLQKQALFTKLYFRIHYIVQYIY